MLGSEPFSERTIPPSLRFFPLEFPPFPPLSGTGASAGALEEEPPGVAKFRKTSVALEGEEALPPDGSTSMPCAAAGLWEKDSLSLSCSSFPLPLMAAFGPSLRSGSFLCGSSLRGWLLPATLTAFVPIIGSPDDAFVCFGI